jgi:predicted TIM-barrel fold metal-dependent hydrolase
VKLSGPMPCTRDEYPYAPITPFAHALVRHAPERLVWGSDWPHVNMNDRAMPNDGDLVDLLAEWVPDAAVRKRILVDNPAALFGFEEKS